MQMAKKRWLDKGLYEVVCYSILKSAWKVNNSNESELKVSKQRPNSFEEK